MQQIVEQYNEIATFLQDGVALEKLANMQAKLEEAYFYLPIVGQFSSGKSSLINNLIGRRILPTMLSETTAFTTYIYYGEQEYAEIVTADKTIQFDVEQLMALSQRNLQSPTSVSELLRIETIQNTDILEINVYLNHELFKTGIVLVDTPGLNTIISNHENRTTDIIPKAHAVLYVMGKALTAADVQLIASIDQLGIDVMFIRTKLDELRKDENDTPQKIMHQDQQLLEEAIGREAIYFGVTNEADLLVFPHWKSLMDKFIAYLQQDFVQNVEQKKNDSVVRQLDQLKETFLINLEERKQQYEASQSIQDQDLVQKTQQLQADIEYVNERIQKQQDHFHSMFATTKIAIETTYEAQFKTALEAFKQSLKSYQTVEQLQQGAEVETEKQIQQLTQTVKQYTNQKLESYLQQTAADTNEGLKQKVGHFDLDFVPSIELQVEVPTIDDVFIQGEMVREKIEETSLYEERLQEIATKRQQVEGQGKVISMEMQSANEARSELGDYEARYIEKRDTSAQETLKNIGNLVDIAMIFIPGRAFTSGTSNIAKVLTNASKGKKYAGQAHKVAKVVRKTGEVLAKTDKIKDMTKILETAQQKQNENGKEKFNILNILSLEYWFGQAGRMIDGPPQIVEDEEYRLMYLRAQDEIAAKIERAKQAEFARLAQLSLLDTQEERLREEKHLQEKYDQQLKQEMYEMAKKREEENRAKQVELYRNQLANQFEVQLNMLLSSYRENMNAYLERFIEYLPTVITFKLQQKLYQQKQQLEELTAVRQQNKEAQLDYEKRLFTCIQQLNN